MDQLPHVAGDFVDGKAVAAFPIRSQQRNPVPLQVDFGRLVTGRKRKGNIRQAADIPPGVDPVRDHAVSFIPVGNGIFPRNRQLACIGEGEIECSGQFRFGPRNPPDAGIGDGNLRIQEMDFGPAAGAGQCEQSDRPAAGVAVNRGVEAEESGRIGRHPGGDVFALHQGAVKIIPAAVFHIKFSVHQQQGVIKGEVRPRIAAAKRYDGSGVLVGMRQVVVQRRGVIVEILSHNHADQIRGEGGNFVPLLSFAAEPDFRTPLRGNDVSGRIQRFHLPCAEILVMNRFRMSFPRDDSGFDNTAAFIDQAETVRGRAGSGGPLEREFVF